jgi:peptide subunit release factor 1 (eRF1)
LHVTQTLEQRLQPELAAAIGPALERLTALPPGPHPVVSCYVRLGPADRAGLGYLTWKARANDALADAATAAPAREERLALERDIARIGGYLQHLRRLPHARGLAIFACEALDLFLCVPLPRVLRTRVTIDNSPRIAELVAALQSARPVIVAVLDRVVARFFVVTADGAEELPGAFTVSVRGGRYHSDRKDAPGKGERRYHARFAEERHRHYAAVAKRLEELAERYPDSGVVLGGPVDHTTPLAELLPDPLAARVLGRWRLNPTAVAAARLRTAVDFLAELHERTSVAAELAALEDSIGAGRAVEGIRETLRALAGHQVRTLYIAEGLAGSGFRCGRSGRLVLARADCGMEGEPEAVRDVADEAVEDALRDGARVVVVPHPLATMPMDGFAATLRFQ